MSAKTTAEEEGHDGDSVHDNTRPANADDDMRNLFSQLHLPRMNPNEPPTLRILAVADIDLQSAAALAEFALREPDLAGGRVDLCIACGPFVRNDDVRKQYLQGRNRRRRSEAHSRTREETAALEGLMSGTLSQLESIVCRVVYCPHPSDPSTTLYRNDQHLRLTTNSFNLHHRWLQLAPGIGCCAYSGISDGQGLSNRGQPESVIVHHGQDYRNAIRRLLDLGPPSSPVLASPESSSKPSQTILVTQMEMETNGSSPKKELVDFLDSPRAQSQIVLNVAASYNTCTSCLDIQRDHVRLVAPGSLRQHGDFALIDVALFKGTAPQEQHCSWKVDRVQFRKVS